MADGLEQLADGLDGGPRVPRGSDARDMATTVAVERFTGFPAEALGFLAELRAHV
jgi:hypothetical protein